MTKKILITGKSSYVGNQLADWLKKEPEKYEIVKISVRDNKWKEIDFSIFDVVVHVAAVVHKKERPESQELYYKVNRDLTIEIANKAKVSGVEHFIFMSSLSVYGIEGELNKDIVISHETRCAPTTLYGRSKYEAEQSLLKLNDEEFNIAIVRAPMIYGPNSPGNYSKLSRLAKVIPVFPLFKNSRSMIFIDNLSEFLKLIIENKDQGIYLPQNEEYIETAELIKLIAHNNNNKLFFIKKIPFLSLIFNNNKTIKKLLGNLVIDKELSYYGKNYNLINFEDSVFLSEK